MSEKMRLEVGFEDQRGGITSLLMEAVPASGVEEGTLPLKRIGDGRGW